MFRACAGELPFPPLIASQHEAVLWILPYRVNDALTNTGFP